MAPKSEEGSIDQVFHISQVEPPLVNLYHKDRTERLQFVTQLRLPMDQQWQEVRVIECGGSRQTIFDFNPAKAPDPEHTLWLGGNDWVRNLEWDPKEWHWRHLGILPVASLLNYTTKRGYRVALKQNNHTMRVDAELEAEGHNSKTRAKFFNRIWHPYLPKKVSAMQWLILTEGLPVGAWREKLGLPNACQLCEEHARETLQHAFQECPEVCHVWDLFRTTRLKAGLAPAFHTWKEISRGLLTEPPGLHIEEELRWDTATAFTLTIETPWDILRANTLWAIWCQRVELAFRNEQFHLGVVLWKAWRNTIYCGMEAYKELFRHKRNEEKRQETISCFQTIWTKENIFGRLQGDKIKWNLTPHQSFFPKELGAWLVHPIRIIRQSPSPEPEAEFVAQPNLANHIDSFLHDIAANWRPTV
jgi:hypothetical protein